MSYEVRFAPAAQAEVDEAEEWYEQRSAGLAGHFIDTITELKTVVRGFRRYGEPPKMNPLQTPNKITTAWLWNIAPSDLRWRLAGIVGLIFVAGVAVGQTRFGRGLFELFEKLIHVFR